MSYSARLASIDDISAITRIYNQGIEDRVATLESCPKNEAGKQQYKAAGFREVGTYINQGTLDGKWIDITIMEKLLINNFCETKNCCKG